MLEKGGHVFCFFLFFFFPVNSQWQQHRCAASVSHRGREKKALVHLSGILGGCPQKESLCFYYRSFLINCNELSKHQLLPNESLT